MRIALRSVAFATLAALCLAIPAQAANPNRLDAYRVPAQGSKLEQLAKLGYDVTEGRDRGGVTVVATPVQAAKLRALGFKPKLARNRQGRTQRQVAAAQAATGYDVWRPYGAPAFDKSGRPVDNIRTELEKLAAAHPDFIKKVIIGRSLKGQPIIALKVTKNARKTKDGSRPVVLYSATQHAREWIATEVDRRLLHYFVDNYGRNTTDGKVVTPLVNKRELWFVPVANPDGYDYTFESPDTRLWRKNLRDNNGDGQITSGDGVDPNRNWPTNWNYDNEGSSSDPASETYRGTGPASEPETRALDGLMKRIRPVMLDNYHSFAQLLLYPNGWQVETPTADDPLFVALTGTDAAPAVEGFDPDLGAELYTTNGETTDHAYQKYGTLAWTPELTGGDPAKNGNQIGFVFQDDEADVQAEFTKNLPFALDLAKSADDPANPDSHLGNRAPDFQTEPFDVSYGDPQVVQVIAKRQLGKITMKYEINGGRERSASTSEWGGGERFGKNEDVYYRRVRGTVSGAKPGDHVKVWFEAKGHRQSDSFTYEQAVDSGAKVLILSAENYAGTNPVYPDPTKPAYLSFYTDALAANGVGYDVYDVDARGQKAPSALGVLSHYKAVIWYTGDDYVTRLPGQPAGTGSAKVADDEVLAVRSYLNEGGKLIYTGKNAGQQYFDGFDFQPVSDPPFCDNTDQGEDRCLQLSNDFLQYYLGAYVYADAGGLDPEGNPWPVKGIADPFDSLSLALSGAESAGNQDEPATFVVTSSILHRDDYPQFGSDRAAIYDRTGGAPYEPFTGTQYMYSQQSDQAYKRLSRTADLTGKAAGSLDFQISYDTEVDYDYVFVEAHTVGAEDWTTLPAKLDDGSDATSTSTGLSCERGTAAGSDWQSLHPFLAHYQTVGADGTCTPTGSSGTWNAATGNSAGWQHWTVDLSAFANKNVEISITYANDPAVQGLGVFIDDAKITADGAPLSDTSFEADAGGWTTPGPPEGTDPNSNTWTRTTTAFDEGPVIKTADTLYFGFGLEGINGAAARADVLDRSLSYLGVP